MQSARLFTILGLILCGIVTRFLPHPPNFTAINSIALFSVSAFGNLSVSLMTVCTTMFLSDIILGFHSTMFFVYSSFVLTIVTGHWLHKKGSSNSLLKLLPISSLLFFIITNFGCWMTDPMYPKTWFGLGSCFLAAIPFLTYQVAGDLFYGLLFFGCYSLVERRLCRKCSPSLL